MDQPNPKTEAMRVAIECLTLWMEPGPEARVSAADHILRLQYDPDSPGGNNVIPGVLNLSMMLVLRLAREQGAEDLAQRAHEILHETSSQRPDE
jgi:hypothetical protein